jgi:hypothetical protein
MRNVVDCRRASWRSRGDLAASFDVGVISMPEHKYRIGQSVEFFPERGVDQTAKGRYKIVRLFLGERNSPLYRIKHQVDGHERMVDESELGPQ